MMSNHSIEDKIVAMGITLPAVPAPPASFVSAVTTGNLVFLSGQIPLEDGALRFTGKVGKEVSLEDGYAMARVCVINLLAALKSEVGNLDRVKRIVKVNGYVSSAPGFNDQPRVINGASDFLVEVFGKKGEHARAAVGVFELPFNCPVEVEMVVELED